MNPGARLSCRPSLGAFAGAVAGVAIAAALVALAVPGCVFRGATREAATPYNQVVVGRAGDISFTKARPVPGQLALDWQARLPFRGEVSPAERMAVGPGPVIAVDLGGGSGLYDQTGALLGERPGSPAVFLPDGSLVAVGGRPMITAYRPDGSIFWSGAPWPDRRRTASASRPSSHLPERPTATWTSLLVRRGFRLSWCTMPAGSLSTATACRLRPRCL